MVSNEKILHVLIDSTYILPGFGIGVEGLSRQDLKLLDELYTSGRVHFYYSPIIWVEILPKVFREKLRGNIDLSEQQIYERIVAVEETFTPIGLLARAVYTAYRLRERGHRDMVDNLLYGIAFSRKLLFMSMDREFYKFLESINRDTSIVISHKELFSMTRNTK